MKNTIWPELILPCSGIANFDHSSGISYRCEHCCAVVGSVGMPRRCQEEQQKWDGWKALGGVGWDPIKGQAEVA